MWLSGNAQYTRINVECGCAGGRSTCTAGAASDRRRRERAAPRLNPRPPAAQSAAGGYRPDPLPADQGCYLFQNFVGPELNVTVTAKDWAFSDNFRVPEGGEMPYCFAPGRYAVTGCAAAMEFHQHRPGRQGRERFLFPLRRR
ncbi:MAG: hypothetical protein R2838_14200 [Caldilineaceae bacterium]